jgi:hypothetical protein
MVEYLRGIKAGFISGLITGMVFSIIVAVLIYQLSAPLLSVPETAGLGIQDTTLATQVIMPVLISSVLFMLLMGIFGGAILGLIVSFIILKVNIKTIYTVVITSILFFFAISYRIISRIISFRALVGTESTLIFVIFITSFAVVEGILLNHFWNRFKGASAPATSSALSEPRPLQVFAGT